MSEHRVESPLARRLFLAQLGAGVGAGIAGASLVGSPAAAAQSAAEPSWRPARHAQDDWLDKIPGVHRLLFDTTTADNLDLALLWATNYVATNLMAYGLKNTDLAVVIVTRHKATTFAYNDAMWAKYPFGASFNCKDASGNPEKANVYYKAQTSMSFDGDPGAGGNIYQDWSGEACLKRGALFMVCHNALAAFAGMMAMAMHADPKATLAEWKANMLPGFLVVPAGVGALQAAMENGWKILPLI